MADVRIFTSIDSIGRAPWNACFAGELEEFDYLRAIEQSGMKEFRWCYVCAFDDGVLQAAMPAFLNDYPLETTLEGGARKAVSMVRSIFPNALTLKLACLGSPDTEYGLVGFYPNVTAEKKPLLLQAMLSAFERYAAEQGHTTLALKDIPQFQQALWKPVLEKNAYQAMAGLPIASLPITFATMDEYFEKLSPGTRKDMRRKLKASEQVRIEHRDNIDDVLPTIMALYRDTRARADMQFEDLTERFFSEVLSTMQGRSVCTLYYVGDDLLAANLLLKNETTLIDKFFCMDGERGRAHNLYFISWFTNIRYCLQHGLTLYQSGQASYENKLRLGSTLIHTSMYFKHRNRLINGVLQLAAPLLAFDTVKEAA